MVDQLGLFKKYKEIYRESFVAYPNEMYGEYSIELKEADRTAKLRKLTVRNVPKDTILLRLHEYSNLNIGNILKQVLNDDSGIFKCCDYLLISIVNKELYFFFIEIKSENVVSSDVKKQFKGAFCFVDYCHAIIQHFYDMPSVKALSSKSYCILISKGTFNKKPTKLKKYIMRSSPDGFSHHKVGVKNHTATINFESFL